MNPASQWRKFRRSRGITQKQLAIALDITVRAVKYIEAGERDPRFETQRKFLELVDKHAMRSLAEGFLNHPETLNA